MRPILTRRARLAASRLRRRGMRCGGLPWLQRRELFRGYLGPGEARPGCPDIACPPGDCVGLDEASCRARPGCHAVYADANVCDCAEPGCCIMFSRCADGPADCEGPAICALAPPPCGIDGEPSEHTRSYTEGCFEGCVLAADCG